MARHQTTKPNQPCVRCLRSSERGFIQSYSGGWSELESLLVIEWAIMLLSRHVVFSTGSGNCWMKKSFFLAPVSLFFRHARILLPVRDFWEQLHFGFILFSFFFFSTDSLLDDLPGSKTQVSKNTHTHTYTRTHSRTFIKRLFFLFIH